MLIDLQSLIHKYNLNIEGILHVGACQCEEDSTYEKCLSRSGLTRRVYWLEANPEIVQWNKQHKPHL
jgi:hypothetical protein